MRVKATVGNTMVVDSDVGLPEHARVEVVVRAVANDDESTWDVSDEDWAELQTAMDEAETAEGIPVEVALAELRARNDFRARVQALTADSRDSGGSSKLVPP